MRKPHLPSIRPSSSEVLEILRESGNWERVESEARRCLSDDPEDTIAHLYLAEALLQMEQASKAKPHIDFLLGVDPNSVPNHLLAIEYFRMLQYWPQFHYHVAQGLQLDPSEASMHYYAAIGEAIRMNLKRAQHHIQWARQLAPDDPDIVNLEIKLRRHTEPSSSKMWERVAEFECALRLDPENAALHGSLGDVYLEDLEDARTAEGYFREAIRLDPRSRHHQQDLFRAVAQRSLTYRLVSIPSRSFRWIHNVLRAIGHEPWRAVFLLIGFKAVLAFLCWLALMTVLLWPAGKIYEWLLVSELKSGARTGLMKLKWWHTFQQLPRALRFTLFLSVMAILYAILFHLLGIELATGFTYVGLIVLVHLLIIVAIFTCRKIHVRLGRRTADKRSQNRSSPPPLPHPARDRARFLNSCANVEKK